MDNSGSCLRACAHDGPKISSVPRRLGCQANEWACCANTIPPYLKTTGIANTDFLIHVTARPTSGAVLAWALPCNIDQYGRPISGQANFGPNRLDTQSGSRAGQIGTAIHEITHALGFSSSRFADFRQPLNGPLWGYSNVVSQTQQNGIFVSKVITPQVVKQAKQQFNCPDWYGRDRHDCDRMDMARPGAGAELENGPTGSSDFSSHWEKRLFNKEYMTATSSANPVYSAMTLAFFEDTGWYTANYSMAQALPWGYLEGCSFATGQCSEWSNDYFCSAAGEHCSATRDAKGYCDINTYTSSIPSGFQYFKNAKLGGQDTFSDYCPTYQGYSNGACSDMVCACEHHGRASTPACYPVIRCGQGNMYIRVGGKEVACPLAGGDVSVPGFQGTVRCPPGNKMYASRVCSTRMLTLCGIDADLYGSFLDTYPSPKSTKSTLFVSNANRHDRLDAIQLCGTLGTFPRAMNDTFRFCSQANALLVQGAPGYFYVSVFGFAASTFELKVVSDPCTSSATVLTSGLRNTTDCYGNGECRVVTVHGVDQPTCVCDEAFSFANPTDDQSICKVPLPSIRRVQHFADPFVVHGDTMQYYVGVGEWTIYTLTVKPEWQYVYVELKELSDGSDPLVLVRKTKLPSLNASGNPYPLQAVDAAAWTSAASKQRVLLTRASSTLSDGLLYIGVYNTRYGRNPLAYQLTVEANSTCDIHTTDVCARGSTVACAVAVYNKLYSENVIQANVTLVGLKSAAQAYAVPDCTLSGVGDAAYVYCIHAADCAMDSHERVRMPCEGAARSSFVSSVCNATFTLSNGAMVMFTLPQSMQPNTGLELRVKSNGGIVSPNMYVSEATFGLPSIRKRHCTTPLVYRRMHGHSWRRRGMDANATNTPTTFTIQSRVIPLVKKTVDKRLITQTSFLGAVMSWLTTAPLGIVLFSLLLIFLGLTAFYFVWRTFRSPDNQDSAVRPTTIVMQWMELICANMEKSLGDDLAGLWAEMMNDGGSDNALASHQDFSSHEEHFISALLDSGIGPSSAATHHTPLSPLPAAATFLERERQRKMMYRRRMKDEAAHLQDLCTHLEARRAQLIRRRERRLQQTPEEKQAIEKWALTVQV
ncbi:hypothetical protein DYB32_000038 [Aphanomyces invadans]|uniref:Uncharacterized protein n=1 Tax=Aphanomyces invadans TaxID=157072 RepID=A0A3R7AGQ3_9STRA|nr:hypothetical protein DYB32_000038 [Aphanomyces invadans]